MNEEPMAGMPIEQALTLKAMLAKVISYIAAGLGLGTFMGIVNTAIGVLSFIWLVAQLYGYVRYELPLKRYKRALARRQFERDETCPAPLEAGRD